MATVSNLDGQATDELVSEVASIWLRLDPDRRSQLAEEAELLMQQQAAENEAS